MTVQTYRTDPDPSDAGDQSADLEEVATLSAVVAPQREIGVTGLNRSVGYINEEFLPALRGQKATQIYREMLSNSALIGASVSTVEMLIKGVSWEVNAPNDSAIARQAEEIVRMSMDEMETSWRDFIAEALSFIWYGWAFFETTYVKRDGYIGWADMSIRGQESLVRWVFDEKGRAVGMVQSAPPKYAFTTIPLSRGVHIRNRSRKRSPEGQSALRNAYESWYHAKRIMQVEAIGVERDLAGLPVMWLPADILRDSDKSPAKKKQLDQFTKLVRSVRRDSNEGLVLPLEYDTETKQKRYNLELLSSGGGRQFDTNKIIERYEQRMLQSMMTDFIMLGALSATGSYAMHLDKTGMLRTSLNGHAQQVAESLNRQAIPKLMTLNSIPKEHWPKIEPSDVDAPNLGELSAFMQGMAGLGMQFFPDADMEAFVRKSARMPKMTDAERTVRTKEKRKADVTRFLGVQASLLEAKGKIREMAMSEDTSLQVSSNPELESQAQQQQLEAATPPDPAMAAAQGGAQAQQGAEKPPAGKQPGVA